MSHRVKYQLWDIAARTCAVLPPIGCSLYFFPAWVEESAGCTLSGITVLTVLVCMIPFWKKLRSFAKTLFSTSMPVFWLILFGVFYCLRFIADSIMYISLAGLGGSVISMLVCIKRNKYRTESTDS